MKTRITIALLLLVSFLLHGCNKSDKDHHSDRYGEVEVVINNVPFPTEKYIRIPYTLKMWEFKKDGLSMQQIIILDGNTNTGLMTIDKKDFPRIWEDPIPSNPYMQWDKIDSYYFSIQLPIPLSQSLPAKVTHRFLFRDTLKNTEVTIEGGTFYPKTNETPIVIASPVKGTNWIFVNQSTNGYHFYSTFFLNGTIGTGERFAFDNMQVNDQMNSYYEGDIAVNSSYFNYRDTLYAVADGIVVQMRDSLPENNGNSHNVTFSAPIDLAGNYLILDMGGSRYAFYAHCVRYSFYVEAGDTLKEGDPIGLLGNSGNSDAPHLHFQVGDSPDFFMCNGIPFVLKKYTKTGEFMNPNAFTPKEYTNIMMEESTVIRFD